MLRILERIKKWKLYGSEDSALTKPTAFEVLEPRIMLSGDSLLNIAAPEPLSDPLLDGTEQTVQYAELLETNEQVEQQPLSETLENDLYQPICTLYVNDEPANMLSDSNKDTPEILGDSSINNVGPAQPSENLIHEMQPDGALDLPGLYLIDPNAGYFDGQTIYLDFDGELNVTYNGPVVIVGINIPVFSAAAAGLTGQESAIISQILSALNEEFEGAGVLFTSICRW